MGFFHFPFTLRNKMVLAETGKSMGESGKTALPNEPFNLQRQEEAPTLAKLFEKLQDLGSGEEMIAPGREIRTWGRPLTTARHGYYSDEKQRGSSVMKHDELGCC